MLLVVTPMCPDLHYYFELYISVNSGQKDTRYVLGSLMRIKCY